MKRIIVFVAVMAVTFPAHAFLGFGDITFDPTTYGEVAKQYQQMVQLFNTAKQQLDSITKIEKTIKDAQQAYQTLASTDLKQVAAGLKPSGDNTKTAAGLRAELEKVQGNAEHSAGYVSSQLSLIKQLENLELLQKASAANVQQTTGEMNTATSEKITAQSSSTLAALAAAQEQRRVQEDYARAAVDKAQADNLNDTVKLYGAMAK